MGERAYMTRNRRGKPYTPLMDEICSGVPTGRVVSSYFKDGKVDPDYVDDPEAFEKEFTRAALARLKAMTE